MPFVTIDAQKCKRDGLCVSDCPSSLFVQPTKDSVPQTIPNAEKMCIDCGHCVAICPHDALTLRDTKPEDLPLVDKKETVNTKSLQHLVRARRSIRQFKDKPVPHETIAELLDIVRWAPSAINLQPVHWLVIETPAETRKMVGMIAEAFIINKMMPDAFVETWKSGKDVFLRGAPHLLIAHAKSDAIGPAVDSSIALSYFEVIAAAYGIGTCWAGVMVIAAGKHAPLLKALNLPEGHQVYGAMMFGYPKYRYRRIPQRKAARISWR
jgi:nitroreductase/NAD-dependent dihydropyrimidine dehydrogenase PreA subunit